MLDKGQAIGARLARGDESAIEDAYAAYSASLLSFLRRYVGADEAEDVLQRTFLDVWRSAARYNPAQRFSTWLFTLAHRRAVDTLRTRHPAPGRPGGHRMSCTTHHTPPEGDTP